MSAPRDVDRLLNSFLQEGPMELPDASYDQVRARIDQTRQRAVLGSWRTPDMNNNIVRVSLAAAAVVVIAIIAINLLPGMTNPGGEPSVSPSAEPSEAAPSAAAGLPVGPWLYVSGQADDPDDNIPPITVTIPAPGWETGDEGNPEGGGILLKGHGEPDGAGMILFHQQEYLVYGDPCSWESTTPDVPVSNVDEFMAALAAQPSRDASEPVVFARDGHSGMAITLHVPDDADFSQCDEGTYSTWACGDLAAASPCGFVGGPGETSVEYILDVHGVLVAWHTSYGADAAPDLVAELEAIVQSASFGD
jgi:hypothetical protein